MLPQELYAHVQQLHCVQGAAAQLGADGGVGRLAVKPIQHLAVGQVAAAGNIVGVARVPGEGNVGAVKHALAGHEGLAGAALLGRAAEEFERSLGSVLQIVPHGQGRAHGWWPRPPGSCPPAHRIRPEGR